MYYYAGFPSGTHIYVCAHNIQMHACDTKRGSYISNRANMHVLVGNGKYYEMDICCG